MLVDFAFHLFLEGFDHRAGEISFHHRGMHVALAADGRCVAEAVGDSLDGGDEILFGLRVGVGRLELPQQRTGENGSSPRSKILRGKILLGDLAKVVVDVRGVDRMSIAFIVEILKQFVAGKVAAARNDLRKAAIFEVDSMLDAALALEVEGDRGAFDGDVLVAQSR